MSHPRPPPHAAPARPPRVLVFDSGLGGLTVLSEIDRLRPDAERVYVADDAVFPYGDLAEPELVARVLGGAGAPDRAHRPDAVVVACNTASTARAAAAAGALARDRRSSARCRPSSPRPQRSLSRRIAVLATPGTVARDYTRDLVRSFAGGCAVDLVGAPRLAALAEAALRGDAVDDAAVLAEIAPAFVDAGGRRTDTVVLACTHYPLLVDVFRRGALAGRLSRSRPRHRPAPGRRAGRARVPAGRCARPVRAGAVLFTSGRPPGPALARALAARLLAQA